jgi:L-threonylcarbamoyladenylate synthase
MYAITLALIQFILHLRLTMREFAIMVLVKKCTDVSIKDAAARLIAGHLVVFPTETVYGLGADARNTKAVSRIYEVKDRPINHPLIVHISSAKNLSIWSKDFPEYVKSLAKNFWPGPMTLILPRSDLVQDNLTGQQDYVAVRVPGNFVALEILKRFESRGGLGVVAPSANRFGKVSSTCVNDVNQELKEYLSPNDLILDDGNSHIGMESTIINCTSSNPVIVRPGAITAKMVKKEIGINLGVKSNEIKNIKSSGNLISHYAPDAKLFISGTPLPGDGFIALRKIPTPSGVIRLASPNNNQEYARLLYRALHLADSKKISRIFVVPPIGDDIAVAINDRLQKASFK